MSFLAITNSNAKNYFSDANYAALENGAPHTLTREEAEDVGEEFATCDEAVTYLISRNGGWVLDESMDSTWHGENTIVTVGAPAKTLVIVAAGGTTFQVSLVVDGDTRGEYLGSMEFGSINADGQYEQDDDEVIEAVRKQFSIDESIPAR